MLKNAFKKHPLQNRTNVQIKGGGGQRPFEQCSKKLHFSERRASLIPIINVKEMPTHGKDSSWQFRCNIKKSTLIDCCVNVSLILEGKWGPAHPLKSSSIFLSSRPPHMRIDPKFWCLFTFSSGPPISPQPIARLFQISRQSSREPMLLLSITRWCVILWSKLST